MLAEGWADITLGKVCAFKVFARALVMLLEARAPQGRASGT